MCFHQADDDVYLDIIQQIAQYNSVVEFCLCMCTCCNRRHHPPRCFIAQPNVADLAGLDGPLELCQLVLQRHCVRDSQGGNKQSGVRHQAA